MTGRVLEYIRLMGQGRVQHRMSGKLRAQCEHVDVRFLAPGYVGDALKYILIFPLVKMI